MSIPLLIDFANGEDSWVLFLNSMVTTIFVGGFSIAATRLVKEIEIHQKELILAMCVFWVLAPVFAALPLLYSSLPYRVFDCYFEAISAMSTTGSTIIYSFDSVSHGIMIWRAILQIIGACIYIMSSYYIIKITYIEGALDKDTSILYLPKQGGGVLRKKAKNIIVTLLGIITCGSFFIGVFCNRGFFESFFIASSVFTTTGIPYKELLASEELLYVLLPFMFISGLPLYNIVKWKDFAFSHNLQLKVYVGLFFLIAIFNILFFNPETSFVSAASTISTNNILLDTNMPFIFSFIGGCAGSPSGGIKVIRLIIILLALQKTFKEIVYGDTQIVSPKNHTMCAQGIMRAVLAYFSFLIILTVSISLGLSITGISFADAISYAGSSITNTALLSANGAASSMDVIAMPSPAKALISFSMILGRLELFPLFAIISPKFWKR